MSSTGAKFRIVYVENCSNISSQKPLFTGTYETLDEIKERLEYYLPTHPNVGIEYYTKKFGLRNRRELTTSELPSDLESIYVYLRSKKPMSCHICEQKNRGAAESHAHM
jgi:hypothetical protein